MFPHLVAGPIVRYVQVQSDLTNRTYDKDLFMYGMYRFIIGLNKKTSDCKPRCPDSGYGISGQPRISDSRKCLDWYYCLRPSNLFRFFGLF